MTEEQINELRDKIDFMFLYAKGSESPHKKYNDLMVKMLSYNDIQYINQNSELHCFDNVESAPILDLLDINHSVYEGKMKEAYGTNIDSPENLEFLAGHFQKENPSSFIEGQIIINELKDRVHNTLKNTIAKAKISDTPTKIFHLDIEEMSYDQKEDIKKLSEGYEKYFKSSDEEKMPFYDLKDAELSIAITLSGHKHEISSSVSSSIFEGLENMSDISYSLSVCRQCYDTSSKRSILKQTSDENAYRIIQELEGTENTLNPQKLSNIKTLGL